MKANGLPAILMSLTILLFGCALADKNAFSYPNKVLDGTDLVDIGAFRTAEPSTGMWSISNSCFPPVSEPWFHVSPCCCS